MITEDLIKLIDRMEVKDGDLLILRVPEDADFPTVEDANLLSKVIQEHHGIKVAFAVLPIDCDIERIPAEKATSRVNCLSLNFLWSKGMLPPRMVATAARNEKNRMSIFN